MMERRYSQEYTETEALCDKNMAIVQPFLKQLGTENNEGTGFYSNVQILSGPGQKTVNYFANNRPDLYERWQKGDVAMYNVKWSGVTFVLEYRKPFMSLGQDLKSESRPAYAFMVYKNHIATVPMKLVLAVKNLHSAQEYLGMLWGNMHNHR